ncbi:MAG: MFS transporter [Candidatus Njordarchaeia archaeon]
MSIIDYLEKAEVKGFHYKIIALAFLSYAFTAMDVLYIAALLKSIQIEMGFDNFMRSVIAAIGYLGMFIGAISFGYIADKIGRKISLALAIVIYSVFTALCGAAGNPNELILYRTIAGIGLGGALPIPGVYVSEYIPAKLRGTATGLIETAWVWGVLSGLVIEYFVLPVYGWRITFLIGVLPIVIVPFIVLTLPESIRYLERKGRLNEAIKVLKDGGVLSGEIKVEETESVERSFSEILTGKFLRRIVLIVILWMVLVYTYHGIFLWYPTFIQESFFKNGGIKAILSAYILITIFQIPGYYSATFLLDRLGRKKVLIVYLTGAAIGTLIVALNIGYIGALIGGIIISIFNLGSWAALYTYTPELFPTDYRGRASGLAASFGRLSGIIGVFVTGILYEMGGLTLPFLIFTALHLVGAIAVAILGIETKKIQLETLTEI